MELFFFVLIRQWMKSKWRATFQFSSSLFMCWINSGKVNYTYNNNNNNNNSVHYLFTCRVKEPMASYSHQECKQQEQYDNTVQNKQKSNVSNNEE
jgi:hypothetical protein